MKKEIKLFEILIIYVCIVSLLNVISLCANLFYPLISLGLALIIEILALWIFKFKIVLKDQRFTWIFLLILIFGFALRLNPNLYLTGGQDQGTYVALSQQYDSTHGLSLTDEVRNSLTSNLQVLYDKANTLLGVDLVDSTTSKFTMPFYPVLPSWLSIGGNIFGSDNRCDILTFFGLLSICAVYLFAYEVSGRNRKVALLASIFAAVNPAHVYFSRIPLTEIISSGMFLLSFYYLLKFYNDSKAGVQNISSLILSLLTVAVLFFTRMSGLLYAPIILGIPILLKITYHEEKFRKRLELYCIGWVITLLISYLFYYLFIPDLFNLIMGKELLGTIPVYWFVFGFLSVYLCIALLLNISKIRNFVQIAFAKLRQHLTLLMLILFFGLIGYELVKYGYTTFIAEHNTLLSSASLSNLKQLNFEATLLIISPFLFILLPVGIFHFRKEYSRNASLTLLMGLLAVFFAYCWIMLDGIPYYYYFVRYQFSELIPLCLVFVAWYIVEIYSKRKVLCCTICGLSILYMSFFSFLELRNYEGMDKASLEQISTLVDSNDLLVVVRKGFTAYNQVVFPLKYYEEVNVLQIPSVSSLIAGTWNEVLSKYDKVYILSSSSDLSSTDVEYSKEIDVYNNYFVHCNRSEDAYFNMEGHSPDVPLCKYIVIPNRYYYGSTTLYLYIWK